MTTAASASRGTTVTPGLRVALVGTVLLAVVAAGLAAVLGGSAEVRGALVGAALVGFFFGFGALTVGLVASHLPQASLLVAMLTYTLQVVLAGLVFWKLSTSGTLDQSVSADWVGSTVIAGTIGWVVAMLVSALRARELLYDLPAGPATPEASVGEVAAK